MGAIEPKQALLLVLVWISLILLWGIGSSWIWVFWRSATGQAVIPWRLPIKSRKIPWGSGTVLLTFVVYLAVNLLAFQGYAWMTGRSPVRQTDRREPYGDRDGRRKGRIG